MKIVLRGDHLPVQFLGEKALGSGLFFLVTAATSAVEAVTSFVTGAK